MTPERLKELEQEAKAAVEQLPIDMQAKAIIARDAFLSCIATDPVPVTIGIALAYLETMKRYYSQGGRL